MAKAKANTVLDNIPDEIPPTQVFSSKSLRMVPSAFQPLNPYTLKPIVNPATEKPVEFSIVSNESREFYMAQSESTALLRQIYLDTKKLPTPQDTAKATAKILASLVVGWNEEAEAWLADELGSNSKYSPENTQKLFSLPEYWWIVVQLEVVVNQKSRFFQKQ